MITTSRLEKSLNDDLRFDSSFGRRKLTIERDVRTENILVKIFQDDNLSSKDFSRRDVLFVRLFQTENILEDGHHSPKDLSGRRNIIGRRIITESIFQNIIVREEILFERLFRR